MAKTSLERSHSKSSNAKLTFLCVAAILFISLTWVLLGVNLKYGFNLVHGISLGVAALCSVLHLIGFRKFKR